MSESKQTTSIKDLKCENVTVFADRAEIKRVANFKLSSGENELVIDGISTNSIDADSVRVEGRGEATVLDVICQNRRVESKVAIASEQVKDLKKEIDELNTKREVTQLKLDRILKALSTLNSYADKLSRTNPNEEKSDSSKIDVNSFMSFLEVYSNKLETLDKEKYQIQNELKEIKEKLDVANSNLNRQQIPETHEQM
jgi:chromosome segregation ATPase